MHDYDIRPLAARDMEGFTEDEPKTVLTRDNQGASEVVAIFSSEETAKAAMDALNEAPIVDYTIERLIKMLQERNFANKAQQARIESLRDQNKQIIDIFNQNRSNWLEDMREFLEAIMSEPEVQGTEVQEILEEYLKSLDPRRR